MDLIEGRQPVREALRAGRPMRRILVAEGAPPRGTLAEILELARAAGVRVERIPRPALERRASSRAHQGVIAEAEPQAARSWRDALAGARARGGAPLFLAMDGIEDPQNAGAILRSAEVFGADAVLIPRRRAAQVTPAVVKASAGATEHLVVDSVPNLERALAACKEEGMWVVALAHDGDQTIDTCDLLSEPLVLVVGSEGTGVSRLIRERADQVVRIPTQGKIMSLNASAATAICLWEAARRRW